MTTVRIAHRAMARQADGRAVGVTVTGVDIESWTLR
jgi:hypothetical protein